MNIKTEELKKMITNTAHDLRTPLTSIAKEFIELTNGNISAIKEDGLLKMTVNIKKNN